MRNKYEKLIRAWYELVGMEWLQNPVIDDVDTGEEENDDGGHLSPELPVWYEDWEGDHIGDQAEDGQGGAHPARRLQRVWADHCVGLAEKWRFQDQSDGVTECLPATH